MDTKNTLKSVFQASSCLSAKEIKNYLANKTSKKERFRIEKHLLSCPLCTDALEGLEGNKNVNTGFDFDEFLSNIQPADTKNAKVIEMPSRRFNIRRIATAAAILLMGATALYFWNNNDQRLYSQFYESYESDAFVSLRDDSSANVIDADLLVAFEKYDAKKYKESSNYFEKFLIKRPQNTEAIFYAGLTYLENGLYDKSIDYLIKAKNSDNSYAREATWYAALAYLKIGNEAKAKELTNELIQKKGRYFEKLKC